MKLEDLRSKYTTDKYQSGYIPVYEQLFNDIRSSIKNVLEIGIGTKKDGPSSMKNLENYVTGDSLRLWRDYFPNGDIYGIDVQDDCQIEEGRIKTFLCDSTDIICLNNKLKDLYFDIIIDDGSHLGESQAITFLNLFDRLNERGFYIIEDIKSGEFKTEYQPLLNDIINKHSYFYYRSLFIVIKDYSGRKLVKGYLK